MTVVDILYLNEGTRCVTVLEDGDVDGNLFLKLIIAPLRFQDRILHLLSAPFSDVLGQPAVYF